MEIQLNDAVVATVLQISGDIDASSSTKLAQAVNELLGQGKVKLVVDLSGVAFMDSSGIASLVLLYKRSKSALGDLRVCGLQDGVQALFDMTRLNRLLDVFPDATAAMADWSR